jgi:hypothetical protein
MPNDVETDRRPVSTAFPAIGQLYVDPHNPGAYNTPEVVVTAHTTQDETWIRITFIWALRYEDSVGWEIMWREEIVDLSPTISGVSLADLDGDGFDEVIQRDQHTLRIFNGTNGSVIWDTPITSGTGMEYQVTADIDGDDMMEVVVLGTDTEQLPAIRGVFAFKCESPLPGWVNGRNVWNDFTYHVTNINEDGVVPRVQKPSWLLNNSFLAQESSGSIADNVFLDIKPKSCPNPLNPGSKGNGVIPVAILGTPGFDVNEIAVESILLEGVSPIHDAIDDVSTPEVNVPCGCECNTVGEDGNDDLTLKFNTQEIVKALSDKGYPLQKDNVLVLTITGTLRDGTPIQGRDCMKVVKNAKTDIQPQTCPNTIPYDCTNPLLLLPAAVLGMPDFDVTNIDTSTILLEGVSPVIGNLGDVATPVDSLLSLTCACTPVGPDQILDYLFQFNTCEVVMALKEREDSLVPGDTVLVTLTGKFFDGTLFEGEDCAILIGSQGGPQGGIEVPISKIFTLSQSAPNPFLVSNQATVIQYELAQPGGVTLEVYDLTGRLVRTLVKGEQNPGTHSITWDGKGSNGEEVASGLFFYRLKSGEFTSTKKMILIR